MSVAVFKVRHLMCLICAITLKGDCEMNILVTGGCGFIGSHTCVELLNAGHNVVVADNLCNSKAEVLEDISAITGRSPAFYETDLRDTAGLEKIFRENNFDAVIHFAGLKAVAESVREPLEYYENNLGATFTLCRVMDEFDCRRLVFSSSATVYGVNNPVPFREGMPTAATNPYGRTKIMIEQMLEDLAAADSRWRICVLRYFNPIGAHPSGLIGEDPNGTPNNLVPYVSQVAAGLRERVTVYGNDYDTPDGTGVRDYIHVVDLARGHIAALKFTARHEGIDVFNLGTGKGTSVLEIINAYSRSCGHKIDYEIAPRRPGDIASCYADISKAQKVLGWSAKRGIQEMCDDSWRFAKKRYCG